MIQKHTITTDLTKLDKIIHLADVHIRLYRRHAEYIEVFDRLYKSLKQLDLTNTAIVLAGDIVHAKTDMSPEMVAVTSDFLNSMADLAPTILIAGNHDLNLANPSRMDALSPIVDNLQNENLHYLTTSGIYQFADVEFGLCAITDAPDDWPLVTDLDDTKPKIGLFHGPVNRAQTDAGYTVTNRITVERFAGYDMVLLGDIHKTQILQEYDGSGIPEIFYPGSLIQQNHGESLKGHGYGIWDVATRKVEEYVEVENKYGYHTIRLTDAVMPDISGLPENLRLRLMVGDVDSTLVKKVQAAVRRKYNVVECTVNKLIDKQQSSANGTATDVDNINDAGHQNTLIKSYIESHVAGADPDLIQLVLDINTQLNARIGEDELPKNISWRPIKLTFDNLFSYGEGNSINFDDMEGLYGVFSPNATGKTSAFDALCFALYDKTPRAFKGSHIMNTRCDTFTCELTIEIEQNIFLIERIGTRKKNAEVKVDVNFYRLDGEDKICLNGEDRRDTNASIRSYVGTYDDFILTSLSVQNQNSLFIETGQTDRKDLLSQFIGLTVFDRLYNSAADEIKEVAGALKVFRKDDFTQRLADTQSSIESEQQSCDSIQAHIVESGFESGVIGNLIKSLYEQKVPEVDDIDIDVINKKLVELENSISIKIDERHNKQIKRDMAQAKKLVLSSQLPQQTLEDISKQNDEFIKAQQAVAKLQSEINVLRTDAVNKKDKLEKLKEHKYDPNCEFCMNNVFVKDAQITRTQYDSLLNKIDSLEDRLYGADAYMKSRAGAAVLYKETVQTYNAIHEQELITSELDCVIINADRGIDSLHVTQLRYKNQIEQFERNKLTIETNRELQSKIDELERKKATLDSVTRQLQNDHRNHDRELSVLRAKKDEMLKSIKDAEELETTYEAYETYLSVIGRDGLPYELISQVIPTLESEANNVLAQIVDFTISLEVDGKNINGKILYEDDRTWPLELASGMEKFVSGLAIRVALMSVSNLPKSNFLVIDEGLGVLDSDNLASMSMLFNILKTQFDFLILISHLDTVRDIADTLLEIRREDGYSYITVD